MHRRDEVVVAEDGPNEVSTDDDGGYEDDFDDNFSPPRSRDLKENLLSPDQVTHVILTCVDNLDHI